MCNILITGASRGIGRKLVDYYKKNKIYAISTTGVNIKGVEDIILDLSDLRRVREVSKYLQDKNIDLVILNAGISLPHSSSFPPFEEFEKLFKINFLSHHALLEFIIPSMQKRKKGKIVFISSLASLIASPTSIAYSASKRAINSYAQSLRNMLAKDNIKVINILPGFIKTDMTNKNNFYMPFLMELDDGVKEIVKAIENEIPQYAFPKRFYYLIKIFSLLPIKIQDKLLQKLI